MGALIGDAVPIEIPGVNALAKDLMQSAYRWPVPSNRPSQPPCTSRQSLQRILTCCKFIEQESDGRGVTIGNDDASSGGSLHVSVSGRSEAGVETAPRLLEHAL